MFYFCGLGLNLKLLKFSFYSTYKQYKLFWYFFLFLKYSKLKTQTVLVFFSFLKYSKLNIGIFILQNIFSLFPIHLSIKSFLLPKLWLKCPTFFVAGLGPIVFFYRWITWPGVLLGCFLVLTWCCSSFDWLNSSLFLTEFPIISWLRPSSCLLCLSTTGFCFIILQRRSRSVHSWNGIIFAYDALVVVVLLLVWLVMSSTFSSFFFISLVYYLKYPAVTLFILLHCSGR